MTVHVRFIEVGDKLTVLEDCQYDLTSGSGLPVKGDIVWLYSKNKHGQFWVVERHWNIGTMIGMVEIYVSPTSEQARTI